MILSHHDNLRKAIVEIPLSDPRYPAEWREVAPPQTLYALGNVELLKKRKFAVVGSRKTPTNAIKLGSEITQALSKHFVIVTGVADGGDSAAIQGALAGNGEVVCLLAGGFSALPQSNLSLLERVLDKGLLLAYQPFETPVRSFSYEGRNKLLAALCEGVLVLGAGEKSGALITARYAYKQKKKLFALPYPPNSASGCGCNAILKAGGYLTENATDIAKQYGIDLKEDEELITLTEQEQRVYEIVKERVDAHANELSALSQIPPYKIRAVLSSLEIKGLLAAVGGNRYTIIK